MTRNGIPNPRTHDALSVSDGGITVGYVIEHGGSFFAFAADAELIGEYPSQREAVRAIPARGCEHERT